MATSPGFKRRATAVTTLGKKEFPAKTRAELGTWNRRSAIACKKGRAEDILTLASDLPAPHHRRKFLRQCGDALLSFGHLAQSAKLFAELCEDPDEQRARRKLTRVPNRRAHTDAAGRQPSARRRTIALCSGHMIDTPTRKIPRFPNHKAEAVRGEIAALLAKWKLGPGDLAVCGGACGADILFAEECLRRGATVRLLLARDVRGFVRNSVQHAGSGWVRRFHALRRKSEVATQPVRLGPAPHDVSIYVRTNVWLINTARAEVTGSAKIRAILVWDEKTVGDGPGGTSDFRAEIRSLGGRGEIINPLHLTSTH